MNTYRLQDPKRGVLGPIRLEMVRDLIAAGALDPAVRLARGSGPFLPIDQFAELREVVADAPGPRQLAGDFKRRTFFNVFYEVFLRRAIGKLTCKRGETSREVYFEEGHPVFIASNLPGERFGEYLVTRGLLDPADLTVALASMHTDKNRLGQTLVRLGLMEPATVFANLREQQVSRLVDLCTWESGQFHLKGGERYTGDKFNLDLDAAELLVRAARAMPDALLLERIDPYLEWRVELSAGPDRVDLELSGMERGVLQLLNGENTPAGIFAKLFANDTRRRAALMVIYLLWEAGLVVFRPPT